MEKLHSSSICIHKNCEILSVEREGKKDNYCVLAKFTDKTSECVAPIRIQGDLGNVIQVTRFLAEKFASKEVLEKDLENPLLERIVFEVKEGKVLAKDIDSNRLLIAQELPSEISSQVEKISLQVSKFFISAR